MPHRTGIFSLHEVDGHILTASKDKTVAHSRITESSIQFVRRYEDYHSSVVKCARFREGCSCDVFASCGNDLLINVMDGRAAEPSVVCVRGVHDHAINNVSWHPFNEHLLLSAGFDTKMQLCDLRNTAAPLFTLRGHVAPTVAKCKNIYRPVFVANGSAIATGGEKTDNLYLFSTATGAMISRGDIGFEATNLLSRTHATTQLAIANKRTITTFSPR
eukprot:TRINITY_DN15331_c0_g1_i1.p1 TRINITY_DN15331_c0_g1~~TRINITY_DN15331_c0_g1_i1.p1  ORF type:complete len:217 (+),score=51.66 TRINITY_DN15331_c0_g1_i1:358-1008(+)